MGPSSSGRQGRPTDLWGSTRSERSATAALVDFLANIAPFPYAQWESSIYCRDEIWLWGEKILISHLQHESWEMETFYCIYPLLKTIIKKIPTWLLTLMFSLKIGWKAVFKTRRRRTKYDGYLLRSHTPQGSFPCDLIKNP